MPTATPFVGRTAPLGVVAAAAAATRGGRPSVVSIEGSAGSGKTTLLRQAMAQLGDGTTVVVAEADELAKDVPMAVVRMLADGPLEDGPLAAGQALLARWSDLADGSLLAVVVEDLHWADPSSRQALAAAAKRLEHERLLLLTTVRPDHRVPDDGWERLRADTVRCTRLALDALSWTDVAELAAARGTRLDERAARRLHAHTGGNPLYASTLLAELSEDVLNAPGGELPAPRTLAATTVGRLAELPAASYDLAAALAVMNRPTPLALVATVGAVDDPATAFDGLLSTGFVAWDRSDPRGTIAFVHPVFRAAVYDEVSPPRRRALHAAAADVSDRTTALAHRVAAADRADEDLARELEEAATCEQSTIGVPASTAPVALGGGPHARS